MHVDLSVCLESAVILEPEDEGYLAVQDFADDSVEEMLPHDSDEDTMTVSNC